MTHTAPPARRPRAPRLAATALTLAALVGIAATGTPATAATSAATTLTATLSPPSFTAAGADLTVQFAVSNRTDADARPTGAVLLGSEPLPGGAAIDAWLSRGEMPGTLSSSMPLSLDIITPGTTAEASVTFPADQLVGRAAGVYALELAVAGEAPVRAVTTLAGDTAAARSVPVAVVVSITAGARTTSLLSSSDLDSLTGTSGRLTALLDGVAQSSAVLAIDPAIIASIRVLGQSAPRSATAWLQRLESLPNARFALQFGDADVTAQAAAGLAAPLGPTSLAWAMQARDFAASGGDPAASPAPEAAQLPDLSSLTTVAGAQAGLLWPARGALTASLAGPVQAYAGTGGSVLVSSSSLAAPAASAVADAAGTRVLVYDDAASAVAARLVASAEGASTAQGSNAESTSTENRGALQAELAARVWQQAQAASGPVLVAIDRPQLVSAGGVQAAIAAATGFPGASTVSLGGLAGEAAGVSLVEGAPASVTTGADAVTRLQQGEAQIEAFAPVLDTPEYLTGRQRARTLQLLGAAWASETASWQSALSESEADVAATLKSVSIRPISEIQLFGQDSSVPVYVENALPWPVSVTLVSSTDDVRIQTDPRTEAVAAASSNTQLRVGVRSRVASGDATISLTLLGREGQQLGDAQHVEVHVRAEWERAGLIVMAVLVGSLLVVGAIRTVRRRRRARAA